MAASRGLDGRLEETSCRRTAEVEYDRELDGFEAFRSSFMTLGNLSSADLSPFTIWTIPELADARRPTARNSPPELEFPVRDLAASLPSPLPLLRLPR